MRNNLPKIGILAGSVSLVLWFTFFVLEVSHPAIFWSAVILHGCAGFDFALYSWWRNGSSLLIAMQRELLGKWWMFLLNVGALVAWVVCWPLLIFTYFYGIGEYISALFANFIVLLKHRPRE